MICLAVLAAEVAQLKIQLEEQQQGRSQAEKERDDERERLRVREEAAKKLSEEKDAFWSQIREHREKEQCELDDPGLFGKKIF